MSIKLKEINGILNLYNEKLKILDCKEMPIQTAFKLALIIRELDEYHSFYQDRTSTIIQNYGQRTETGELKYSDETRQMIPFKPEFAQKAREELNELQNITQEIKKPLLTMDELAAFAGQLNIEDLTILTPIIEV